MIANVSSTTKRSLDAPDDIGTLMPMVTEPRTVVDPLLGTLTYDDGHEAYVSEPKAIRFLGGRRVRFALAEYFYDRVPDELRVAVKNTLDARPAILTAAEEHVIRYRQDMLTLYEVPKGDVSKLKKPRDVWAHVRFGDLFDVSRREQGDSQDGVYVSLECNCDWGVEHGLQVVLRDGRSITKVGMFDNIYTNVDLPGGELLHGIVYNAIRRGL